MNLRFSSSLVAIALALPVLATPVHGQVSDFQLQPAPSPTPTARPQVQGPVDTEGVIPVRPRVIPTSTPTPSPTATEPQTVQAVPSPTPTAPRATRTATPRPQAQPRRETAPQAIATPDVPAQTAPQTETTSGAEDLSSETPSVPLPGQSAPPETQSNPSTETTALGNYLPWVGGLAGLLALIGGAIFLWRRRKTTETSSPEIEPPTKWVSKSSDSSDLPPLPAAAKEDRSEAPPESLEPPLIAAFGERSETKPALQVKAQALTLSRSLMNATLTYRLELMNLNNRPISEISVKADVVTAHGKAPISEQVVDDTTELPESAFVAAIEGRETHEAKGTFSLPVGSIRPITQRGATLYVPLLRLRVEAAGMDPIICTFVVGVKPPERGAKLQPFRLDEMAQTYRNIGLRLIN